MKTKHTPGPWITDEFSTGRVVTNEDDDIAVACFNKNTSLEEVKANARLIAAAPELLAILKQISAAFGAAVGNGTLKATTVDAALAIIAKAEGDS